MTNLNVWDWQRYNQLPTSTDWEIILALPWEPLRKGGAHSNDWKLAQLKTIQGEGEVSFRDHIGAVSVFNKVFDKYAQQYKMLCIRPYGWYAIRVDNSTSSNKERA